MSDYIIPLSPIFHVFSFNSEQKAKIFIMLTRIPQNLFLASHCHASFPSSSKLLSTLVPPSSPGLLILLKLTKPGPSQDLSAHCLYTKPSSTRFLLLDLSSNAPLSEDPFQLYRTAPPVLRSLLYFPLALSTACYITLLKDKQRYIKNFKSLYEQNLICLG